MVSDKKKEELSKILLELAESGVDSNSDLSSPKAWLPELDGRAKEHDARRYKVLSIEREDEQRREELRLMNLKFYGAPCALFTSRELRYSISPIVRNVGYGRCDTTW